MRIKKRRLCWTFGQVVESGGLGQRTKVYQDNKPYYVVATGPGYWVLEPAK